MTKKKSSQHPFSGLLPEPKNKRKPKRKGLPRDTDSYRRWLDARQQWRDSPEDSLRPPEAVGAELRLAAIDMLRAHANGTAALPGEVAFELAEAVQALHAEQETSFLLPGAVRLQHWKRFLSHPFLEECRKDAVRYVLACRKERKDEKERKDGKDLIGDPHPVKTMREAFGVDESTIYRWVAAHGNLKFSKISKAHFVRSIALASGKQYCKLVGS